MFSLSSHHAELFIAHLTSAIVAGVAVATRIFVKMETKQGIKSDDVFILLTLLFYYGAIATALQELFTNFMHSHMEDSEIMSDEEAIVPSQIYRKAMFGAIMLAMTAQYTCKMSILLFYRRIFFASNFHRDISLGLMAFASTWLLSAVVGLLCICRPLKLIWIPEEQHEGAKCGNWTALVYTVLIVDVLTDVAILLLPIRTVLTLQMPMRTKTGVAALFALGGFVIVTSALRMEIVDPHEVYYHQAELWTTIHLCTAIVCASIPIYKPLWTYVSTRIRRRVMGVLPRSDQNDEDTVELGKTATAGHDR